MDEQRVPEAGELSLINGLATSIQRCICRTSDMKQRQGYRIELKNKSMYNFTCRQRRGSRGAATSEKVMG